MGKQVLTDKPDIPLHKKEGFVLFFQWKRGESIKDWSWLPGYRSYYHLWTALRYGCAWFNIPHYIVDLAKNEIVWTSWEDTNQYRN